VRLIPFADYFYVLRPVLFFPAWTTTIAGYLAVRNKTAPDWRQIEWWNPDLFWIGCSSAMIMGAGFIINQLQDTDTDRINSKLYFLSDSLIRKKHAVVESVLLLISGMLIAALLSFDLLILYMMAILFFMIGYNYKPFAWKNGVWGSLVANAGMGVFAFAFGWITFPLSLFDFMADVLPYLFYNTALYFLTTIPDAEGDRQTGKRTISVAYGDRTTIVISALWFGLGLFTAVLSNDFNILIPSGFLMPFYFLLVIRQNREWVIRTLKFGLFFFSLMIGFYFPLYIAAIIVFFFITRWYYKKRFNIEYPNFKSS
jgi:4-hydroxybenzoate polyprenyltransferase